MDKSKTVYLHFFSAITMETVNHLMDYTNKVIKRDLPTELYYIFSSSGGNVEAGRVLYRYFLYLKQHLTITFHNINSVDSIAKIVYCAATNRYANQASRFLFHQVTWDFSSKPIQTAREINEVNETLKENMGGNALIISEHTEMSTEEVRRLFDTGVFLTAKEAKEKGLVSEIKEFTAPKDAIYYTVINGQY